MVAKSQKKSPKKHQVASPPVRAKDEVPIEMTPIIHVSVRLKAPECETFNFHVQATPVCQILYIIHMLERTHLSYTFLK